MLPSLPGSDIRGAHTVAVSKVSSMGPSILPHVLAVVQVDAQVVQVRGEGNLRVVELLQAPDVLPEHLGAQPTWW